jgi:hypothetical protein
MIYRCDGGEYEHEVYLEEGCEGPRTGAPLKVVLPSDHPVHPNEQRPWPRTPSGRFVVPVPFVAGQCPDKHQMTHVEWHRDRTFDPMLTEAELANAPRFLYPSDAGVDLSACGRLVVP